MRKGHVFTEGQQALTGRLGGPASRMFSHVLKAVLGYVESLFKHSAAGKRVGKFSQESEVCTEIRGKGSLF